MTNFAGDFAGDQSAPATNVTDDLAGDQSPPVTNFTGDQTSPVSKLYRWPKITGELNR